MAIQQDHAILGLMGCAQCGCIFGTILGGSQESPTICCCCLGNLCCKPECCNCCCPVQGSSGTKAPLILAMLAATGFLVGYTELSLEPSWTCFEDKRGTTLRFSTRENGTKFLISNTTFSSSGWLEAFPAEIPPIGRISRVDDNQYEIDNGDHDSPQELRRCERQLPDPQF